MARVRPITIPITYRSDTAGLKKAGGALGKFGGAVAGVAAAAVTSLAAIGTAATRMANEFEQSLAKIEGLVGVSAAEVEKLGEAAAQLGPAFGKPAQEAVDALFFITSAGLRGAEAIDVLEASLKASAAGLGDTASIANAATAAVNTYGSEVLTGTEAVDAFTEAVRLGQFAPEELAGAIGRVIPIASELDVSLQETLGLIAALTRGGLSASEAVTGVRGAMQALLKPTGEAATMLEQYGFSTDEVRAMIEEDGLLATFGTLREAFGENEEDFTRVIGSIEGLNAVLALTGENGETATQIVADMSDELGVLDDAFGTVEDTAGFKFNRAMETARASLLPIGEVLLDIGAKLLDALMPTIERLGPVLEETFAVLEQPLLDLIGLVPDLIDAFLPFLPLIGELAAMVVELAVASMPIFVSLLELLLPIIEMLMPVLGFVVDLFATLAPLLVALIESLTPIVEAILPVFLELWQNLEEPILKIIDALVRITIEVLPMMMMFLNEILLPALLYLAEVFGDLLVFNIGMLAEALTFLADLMEGVGQKFALAWYVTSVTVIGIVNKIIEGAQIMVNAFIRGINQIIAGINAIRTYYGQKPLNFVGTVTFRTIEPPEMPEFLQRQIAFDNAMRDAGIESLNFGAYTPRDLGIDSLRYSDSSRAGMGIDAIGLAMGGIVKARPGGIIANIGEGRYDEAVIPLRNGQQFGSTYNITVNAGVGANGAQVGEQIVAAIKRYERSSGKVFASA